ncbi:hypothetical protein [Aquitalea sp. USM4]|uniref:hypothetical protein n=1 Tax=Aquitalea sp. USM4 TaxID=1590041 RepID=UPI00103B09E5|nr:hypothetical protein [Aquitalea sp. USM4]QBJ80518.1 hypothetical protein DKK66_19915 [Aquitalea sp. USM4]
MALTAQQLADTRRFAGYPMLGDSVADDSRDMAYGWVSPGVWQTLQHRLTNMRPEEEAILTTTFLTPLADLEAAIVAAGDNLDTDAAAVWTRNKSEVSDRTKLFNDTRRRMCAFIGIAPGPFLGQGGGSIVRC